MNLAQMGSFFILFCLYGILLIRHLISDNKWRPQHRLACWGYFVIDTDEELILRELRVNLPDSS